MAKASVSEIEERVSRVYELLISGAKRADILQYATKKAWGVEDRQVDNYIARAKEEITRLARIDRDYALGAARARLNLLFYRALNIQDFKTALAVQKEINALEGFNAPKKIEISWQDQAVSDIRAGSVTFEALAEAFDHDLATSLFERAGVSITSGTS